jgi:hypothetical protein
MKRLPLLFWLLTAGIATALVFQVSNDVQSLERQLKLVKRDILREQESLHVLRAEWSYLNRPDRLAAMADSYLDLEPLPAERVVDFADLPYPGVETATAVSALNDRKRVSR